MKETLPAGFVLKPFHEQRLKAAVEIAHHTYYAVIRPHWQKIEDINEHVAEPLTSRELELLALLCEGQSNRELATRLHVSVNTIKAT
ncbi:MAG: LuxR C-terminal-related transcriptional regulator [Bacteroidia bacterium]